MKFKCTHYLPWAGKHWRGSLIKEKKKKKTLKCSVLSAFFTTEFERKEEE